MKKTLLSFAVLMLVIVQLAFAQSRPVRGKVVDASGAPLEGATVSVKDGEGATLTDEGGNFSLDVPDDNDLLLIEYIGYKTREVVAGDGDKVLQVSMSVDQNMLEETVITALGISREKRSLGYSTSTVGSDLIEKSGERNPIQSLAAKAPGIQVTSSAGTPGASSKILIRGNATFTGNNSPLIVIDGIPVDNSTSQPVSNDYPFNVNLQGVNESNRLNDLNPDDIESVTVLKGPAAASLYGERGGAGAIIITTKKGRYGKKGLGITFTSSVEWNKVNKLPEFQNQYSQGTGGIYKPGITPQSWGARIDTTDLKVYDNNAAFFQTGVGYNNTLAIDGGNENTWFRTSIGNYNTKGIIPNSSLNRTTISLNAESKLAEWLKVGGYVNYSYNEGKMVQNGSNLSGMMLSLFRMPVTYDVTDKYYDPELHTNNNYFIYDNPLFSAYRNPYTSITNRVMGNVYFDAKLADGLSLTYKLGTDAYNNQARQIYDLGSIGNDNSDGTGQLNLSAANYMQVYSDLILKYMKRFDKFDISAFVGHNYWYEEARNTFMRGTNQTVPEVYNFDVFNNLYASNLASFRRSNALFAEAQFGFDDMLYLTLTGRNEWSTTFGKGGKSFFYPKADLSWIFTKYIPQNDGLSYGKLRFAYSSAGIAPGVYSDRGYYAKPFLTDGYTNGNGFPYLGNQGYMTPSTNYPGGLSPERVQGLEAGLELHFWKNRITFEATYYNQVTKDILLFKPVSPSSGYSQEYVNAGKMRNRGLELQLGANLYKSKNWEVSIGANWAMNRNKVLELANGVDEISIESGFTSIGGYAIVGEPYGVFYGSRWQRDASGNIVVDADGYPIMDAKNAKLGDPNPDWLMGLNANVSFKGAYFSMLWDIRQGGDIWNGTWARLNNVGRTDESAEREHDYVVEGVYEDGTRNTTPISAVDYFRYVKGDLGATENAIQDGSWVRLRQVALGYRYNFNKAKGSKNPFNYIDLGLTGRNLLLFTDYKGVDPETSLTGAGSNLGGWDYFNNPGSKSFILTLKVGL